MTLAVEAFTYLVGTGILSLITVSYVKTGPISLVILKIYNGNVNYSVAVQNDISVCPVSM